jgi:hypothetical protein
LDGHLISFDDEVAVLEELAGGCLDPSTIERSEIVVPYVGERRIISNRNVVEVKEPFRAVQISVLMHSATHSFLMCVLLVVLAVSAFVAYNSATKCRLNRTESFRSWGPDCWGGYDFPKLYRGRPMMPHTVFNFSIIADPGCSEEYRPSFEFVCEIKHHRFTFIIFIVACLIAGYAAWYAQLWWRDFWYVDSNFIALPYVPHLVTAVMMEFDRGTNLDTAKSVIRQRIRRLAAFPLPDRDALQFVHGTELMCLHLLDKGNFFWAGAACFEPPQTLT